MKKLLLISLLLTLCGCVPDGEFRLLPVGGDSSGGSFSDWWQGQSPATAPNAAGTAASKMLQDPDSREESTEDYVWAADEAQATALCERTAERNGWRLDRVKQSNSWTNAAGKKRFTCQWTIFVPRN